MVKTILYRETNELAVFDCNEITEEKLLDAFSNSFNTVYITERGKLVGVITIGDFNRNQEYNHCELINKNFTYVKENCSKLSVEEIFRNKKRINAIPIIDNDTILIGEYFCKRRIDENPENNSIMEVIQKIYTELYSEMIVGGYDCVFIKINKLFEIDKNIAKEVFDNTKGKIILHNEISFDEIKNIANEKKIYVCDFGDDNDGVRVRNIYYKKYKIDHMIYFKEKDKIEETKQKIEIAIKNICKVYKKIAILQNNIAKSYIQTIIEKNTDVEVVMVNVDNLKYIEGSISYTQENHQLNDVEVVFILTTAVKEPYILYQNKIIPFLCIFEQNNPQIEFWSDWDIAVNIVPKLQENNVRTIIIGISEDEREIIKQNIKKERKSFDNAFEDKSFWGDDYEYIDQIKKINRGTSKKGYLEVENCETDMVNVYNGIRYTVGNPKEYENTIYVFGPCLIRGAMVTDRYTLTSFLRKKIGKEYYIENRGNNRVIQNVLMRTPTYKAGDIVILVAWDETPYKKMGLKIESIAKAYNNIPNLSEHLWDSIWHMNSFATEYVADEIHRIIAKNMEVANKNSISNESYFEFSSKSKNEFDDIPVDLENWIEELKQHKIEGNKRIGSIVMNCNPFTLGHRYLIEKAIAQVDYLYIFVVEEDKSFFEFKDRIQMVKNGVEDLDNITVLPSGRYIISTETLPGYFSKDDLQSVKLDASNDIDIFGNIIAKCLNISVRLAGEEPIDAFTRQYNETMKRMLPERGIEFIEIPRVCKEEQVISASRVRKLLKEKKYIEIKSLVPMTTYEYLEKKYFE